jgi:hypothetical protein
MYSSDSTDNSNSGAFFNAATSQNWRLAIGSNFGVNSNGTLYAKEAVIGGYASYDELVVGLRSNYDGYNKYTDGSQGWINITVPEGYNTSKHPEVFKNGMILELTNTGNAVTLPTLSAGFYTLNIKSWGERPTGNDFGYQI